MKYVKLDEKNIVIGVISKEREGYVEAPDDVVPGQILKKGKYENPPIQYTTEEVRILRDRMLKESDWTQLADSPLSEKEKSEAAKLRQKLRDVTALKPADAMKFMLGLKDGV